MKRITPTTFLPFKKSMVDRFTKPIFGPEFLHPVLLLTIFSYFYIILQIGVSHQTLMSLPGFDWKVYMQKHILIVVR
jgi:hypothetical protein